MLNVLLISIPPNVFAARLALSEPPKGSPKPTFDVEPLLPHDQMEHYCCETVCVCVCVRRR